MVVRVDSRRKESVLVLAREQPCRNSVFADRQKVWVVFQKHVDGGIARITQLILEGVNICLRVSEFQ